MLDAPITPIPDLIGKLSAAIATGEGYFSPGGPPPVRFHNPGDLRPFWRADQPAPETGMRIATSEESGHFIDFDCIERGTAWLYFQIALNIRRGYTIRKLMETWAPASDGNKTENYLRETCRRVGLPYNPPDQADADLPLWSYLTLEKIA